MAADCYTNRFYESYKRDIFSQNGEDGVIAELLLRLNITEGWVCEFGAWDGVHLSNTFALVQTKRFSAVYIEANAQRFDDLVRTAAQYPKIVPLCQRVEADKLDEILASTPIPRDFDVLSIDVDGIDYHIWKHLQVYRPKIVVIEINSSISPTNKYYIHDEEAGYSGTSFWPTLELGLSKQYRLICHTGNMIFIRRDLLPDIIDEQPLTYFRKDWLVNPEFSIVLTVHNKDWLVERVIESLVRCTRSSFELIVVLDGCTDNSKQTVEWALTDARSPFFSDHTLVETPDVFETKANNVGLRLARGKYSIIVQDDMLVDEVGWEKRLARPTQQFRDIFAVTAQCAHGYRVNRKSRCRGDAKFHLLADDCWCDLLNYDALIDRGRDERKNPKYPRGLPRNVFAVRDSVNRGPLLFVSERLKQLDYFDEAFSPQNMDDHDLCFRAFAKFGWKCGVYIVNYVSKPEWGSTRPEGKDPKWLLRAHHKNCQLFMGRHLTYLTGKARHNEDRMCG
jgi:glycosyltransferase involved in cell wall biosynthesis